MPPAAIPFAAAGAAASAAKAIAVKAVVSFLAKTIVTNVILGAISNALMPKPKTRHAAIRGQFTGGVNHQQIVFGRVRAGGQLLTIGTSGDRNEYLHMATLYSLSQDCGTEGITDVWIDDKKILDASINGSGDVTEGDFEGLAQIRRYAGTSTQTVDSALNTALSGESMWGADAHLKGCQHIAHRHFRSLDDEKFQKAYSGLPVVEALSGGQKCYDPRLDTTAGGSGSHRVDDSSTWEWTDNPALILAQYLIMRRVDGGAGLAPSQIDYVTVAAAANVCDTTISTPDGNIPRYTCNLGLSTGERIEDNITDILACMQGAIVPAPTGLKIFAGAYDAPVATITDDWVIDYDYDAKQDIDNTYNTVRAVFTDPSSDYKQIQAVPFTDAAYVTADDGRVLPIDVSLPGVNNQYRAQYITQLYGRRSRHQKRIKIRTNMRGRVLEAWDTVTVVLPESEVNAVFRVIEWEPTVDGAVIDCIEEAESIYTPSAFTVAAGFSQATAIQDGSPVPTGLTATAVADGIALAWDALDPNLYSVFELERSVASSGQPWVRVWSGKANSHTDPVTDGGTWFYRVRSRAPQGVGVSAYSATASATAKTSEDGATVGAPPGTPVGNTGDSVDVEENAERGHDASFTAPHEGAEHFHDMRIRAGDGGQMPDPIHTGALYSPDGGTEMHNPQTGSRFVEGLEGEVVNERGERGAFQAAGQGSEHFHSDQLRAGVGGQGPAPIHNLGQWSDDGAVLLVGRTGLIDPSLRFEYSGSNLRAAQGMRVGTARDGDSITFDPPFPSGEVVSVQFQPTGGLFDQSALAGDTQVRMRAKDLTVNGFTAELKILELVGSTTPRTASFSGDPAVATKTEAAEAWNQKYTAHFDVEVNAAIDNSAFGMPDTPSAVRVELWTRPDGGTYVKRDEREYWNDNTGATKTFNGETLLADGVSGLVADSQFKLEVVIISAAGGSITADNVRWDEATAPTSTALTPTGTDPVSWFAIVR